MFARHAHQVFALGLSLVVTLALLAGVNSLATMPAHDAAMAAAPAAPSAPATQPQA